ncbi:hypothetical protein H8E88_15295 [candidate division KSB1 bacterium]|nr:hypothetical protein [candidate division KSB1 bacterium]
MKTNKNYYQFKFYGWTGVFIILAAEILLFLNFEPVKIFFTPIAWTGYILFIDAVLYKLNGSSYLMNRRKEFLFMLLMSLICWLIFEAYNIHLQNWKYINLPENMLIRLVGYGWSFITITPGIILTSELIDSWEIFDRIKIKKFAISKLTLNFWVIIGALFLIIPVFLPRSYAQYLFVLIWIGFVFLLDPINSYLGKHSLFVDLRDGKINKLLSLFLSGIICGFLWEFWNYWALTKWIYTLPFLENPRIFEMPLAGFLGFLPFAVECYVMWVFSLSLIKKR